MTNKQDLLNRRITVAGHFGDLELTKVQFAKRWMDHATEMRRLSSTTDWQKTVDRWISKTRTYANIEFERMYKQQQESK